MEEIEKKGKGIVRDFSAFAQIQIREDSHYGKCATINFFWLKSVGDCRYTGWEERISIPYEKFQEAFTGRNVQLKILSLPEKRIPKIRFESRRNLKETAKNPRLRRKLGRFLSRNFQWANSTEIVLYDDFLPYSFGFCEYCTNGTGIIGGVILHGQERMRTADYSMHT